MTTAVGLGRAEFIAASVAAEGWFDAALNCQRAFSVASYAAGVGGKLKLLDDEQRADFKKLGKSVSDAWETVAGRFRELHESVERHSATLLALRDELTAATVEARTPPIYVRAADGPFQCAHVAVVRTMEEFCSHLIDPATGAIYRSELGQVFAARHLSFAWLWQSGTVGIERADNDDQSLRPLILRERAALDQRLFREIGPMSPALVKRIFDDADARTIKKVLGDDLRIDSANSKRWFIRLSAIDRLRPDAGNALRMMTTSNEARRIAAQLTAARDNLHEVAF